MPSSSNLEPCAQALAGSESYLAAHAPWPHVLWFGLLEQAGVPTGYVEGPTLSNPSLSIIIVNWNVSRLLAKCLTKIQTNLAYLDYEVIVVDNASSDDSVAMLSKDFPWVQLIVNRVNHGFAVANNQAFRIAKGDQILVLNPDTEIGPHAIQTMRRALEANPQVGMVGPRIVNHDGAIVRPCRRANMSLWTIAKSLFLTDQILDRALHGLLGKHWRKFADRHYYQSGPTECLQGSCMLMRRRDLRQVGYFDERIPLYLDDGDLCQRFRNEGFEIYYSADAEVVHHGAKSVAKMPNSRMSSMVGCLAIDTFFLKHRNKAHVLVYHLMLFFSSLLFLLVDILLWPFLWFSHRPFIRNYTVKHFWCLVYSTTFQFKTSAFPPQWPRSLKEVLSAPMNSDPEPAPPPEDPVTRQLTPG